MRLTGYRISLMAEIVIGALAIVRYTAGGHSIFLLVVGILCVIAGLIALITTTD